MAVKIDARQTEGFHRRADAAVTAATLQSRPLPQDDAASGVLLLLRRLLVPPAGVCTRSPACTPGLFEGAGRRPVPTRNNIEKALPSKGLSNLLDEQILPWLP